MDGVQFGRWLSERRQKCGFASQRTLVERVKEDPVLGTLGISKDFLARLEVGKFAHPFRGSVRRRILALAWVVCKTPREVQTYVRAAELTELHADETEQLHRLRTYLATQHTQQILPLPPRPNWLIGRTSTVQELLNTLCTMEMGLYAITGMAGVGKSALASETIHLLATNEHEQLQVFPDGIAAFTCTGRQGTSGLLSLLEDVIAVFGSQSAPSGETFQQRSSAHTPRDSGKDADADLARALDRARFVLANKRVLLLLDNVDAQLPLRQALEALLGLNQHLIARRRDDESGLTHRVILSTSQYIFPPACMKHHLHLGPLEPSAALELFTTLIGRPLYTEELNDAEQLCAELGYLPLALEGAAAAATLGGISLSLLAAHAIERPLDDLLDAGHELRSRLLQAFASLDQAVLKRFALLCTLDIPLFGLETAAAMRSLIPRVDLCQSSTQDDDEQCIPAPQHLETVSSNAATAHGTATDCRRLPPSPHTATLDLPVAALRSTAVDVGQLVRHSLLDLIPSETCGIPSQQNSMFNGRDAHYRLHPLISAHAVSMLSPLESAEVQAVRCHGQAYALSYIERHQNEIPFLERERVFLCASLAQAFQGEHYGQVVRFVEGLAPIASRLSSPRSADQLFSWGIQASQKLHDRYHLARFLHDLGWLYSTRGEFTRARQVWTESLEIATTVKRPILVWKPLASLAHVAHIQGECDAALHYTERYLERCQESGELIRTADVLCVHAFYTRLQGDLDEAYNYINSAMSVFSLHNPLQACSSANIVKLGIEVELARIQGDYAQSQTFVERRASLLQEKGNDYLLADLLFDQACFAQQQGRYDDGEQLAQRVIQAAEQGKVQHFSQRARHLVQQHVSTLAHERG